MPVNLDKFPVTLVPSHFPELPWWLRNACEHRYGGNLGRLSRSFRAAGQVMVKTYIVRISPETQLVNKWSWQVSNSLIMVFGISLYFSQCRISACLGL